VTAPKIPTKKGKGTAADSAAIKSLITLENQADTYSEARNFMSSKSMEMFDRTPLFVSDLNAIANDHVYTITKIEKPKFYKGLEYAKVKVKVKNERNKKSSDNYILIKENGAWKMDYVQMLKKEVMKYMR
jgi:hypothetical protein